MIWFILLIAIHIASAGEKTKGSILQNKSGGGFLTSADLKIEKSQFWQQQQLVSLFLFTPLPFSITCGDAGGKCIPKRKQDRCKWDIREEYSCPSKKKVCCIKQPPTTLSPTTVNPTTEQPTTTPPPPTTVEPPQGENILIMCHHGLDHYGNGEKLTTCIGVLTCQYGVWLFQENVDKQCGNCIFGGEPYITTFDPLTGTDYYKYNGVGEYSMTQPKFIIPAIFGVKANFTKGLRNECYQVTCVGSATYYELDLTVEFIISGSLHTGLGAMNVYVKDRKHEITTTVSSFLGTYGVVLVFRHLNIFGKDGKCIIVIGTQGLTMAFCDRGKNLWPWAYIWADEIWKDYPAPLYGMCNRYTGSEQPCFMKQNQDCVADWSDGSDFVIKDDLAESWTWHD